MNDETVELLDAAFRQVHNARGIDRLTERQLAREYRDGIMAAVCVMTGMESESLYETFSERLTAAEGIRFEEAR